MHDIIVENLRKVFTSTLPVTGPWYQKVYRYFFPKYQEITAVNDISFSIKKGERVAFIGPNGAGKSTVIKMLSGIMQPTSGKISVLGMNPFCERTKLAYKIGAVFGNCSQLWEHLPVWQSFELLGPMYDIDKKTFKSRLAHLVGKFNIEKLLNKPLRKLSLGERMRCEIVASFLHDPEVLFLDEPTIGLDIVAKAVLRDLIIELSNEYGVTLLLTSHDTDDIEQVCERAIIIDHGCIVENRSIEDIKSHYIQKKIIFLTSDQEICDWDVAGTEIIQQAPHTLKVAVDVTNYSLNTVIAEIFKKYSVKDITVEDPSLESIIRNIYAANSK